MRKLTALYLPQISPRKAQRMQDFLMQLRDTLLPTPAQSARCCRGSGSTAYGSKLRIVINNVVVAAVVAVDVVAVSSGGGGGGVAAPGE